MEGFLCMPIYPATAVALMKDAGTTAAVVTDAETKPPILFQGCRQDSSCDYSCGSLHAAHDGDRLPIQMSRSWVSSRIWMEDFVRVRVGDTTTGYTLMGNWFTNTTIHSVTNLDGLTTMEAWISHNSDSCNRYGCDDNPR